MVMHRWVTRIVLGFLLPPALVLAVIAPGSAGSNNPCCASGRQGSFIRSYMPPNEVSMLFSFSAGGTWCQGISGIEAKKACMDYLQQKLGKRPEDRPHPIGAVSLARGEKSGRRIVNHHGQTRVDGVKTDCILILLVEFAGTDDSHTGPLHNELPEPDRRYNLLDFWTPDFNREHYENMLFSQSPGALSMANYYLEQSGGTYTVTGHAYGWIPVGHSEWYYGADDPEGGIDNLNGYVFRLVRDAIDAAADSIPWADYDLEDPYDLDGDGSYAEPDGYVDHLMIIHAGAGQEDRGGQQGDDAIWSHSGWAEWHLDRGPGFGGIPTADPGVWVGAYTMEPEDGTIGVFCHEFGHDLGLPDEYDTIYSGDASTGYWTLMSAGAWLSLPGQPLGTCPAGLSVWAKYTLGWAEPIVIEPGKMREDILLRPVENRGLTDKCIKIDLPAFISTIEINKPHSGEHEWHSGMGNSFRHTLTRRLNLPSGTVLRFWTWYDIEKDWDYGCVEVSSDAGGTWQKVAGNITTCDDPHGQNPGHGITGQSKEWVRAEFDLSAFSGEVNLRFRYLTDRDVQGLGWVLDDLEFVSGSGSTIFADDVESGAGAWAAKGWYISSGSEKRTEPRYYLAEWREPIGFDIGMTNWFHRVDTVPPNNLVEKVCADPGMLLWYRDGQFTDNWVGKHPWKGFLLLVDAHPELVLADNTAFLANWLFEPPAPRFEPPYPNRDLPFCTRIQIADAAFGLKPTSGCGLTRWFGLPVCAQMPQLPASPVFDDSICYVDKSWSAWYQSVPFGVYIRESINSVETPACGLKIIVQEESPDGEGGRITVDFTGFRP